MATATELRTWKKRIPDWVSQDIHLYLDHIEGGVPIRALARDSGVHASTVLRKVRKTESRRDDPLVDKVLIHLGRLRRVQGTTPMNPEEVTLNMADTPPDGITLKRDATRILRALSQPGAVLAVVPDVETAVVVCESADGRPRQIATVARSIAEAMALQNWIFCQPKGRVARYYINQKGRVALNRFLAENESERAGFSEAPANFQGSDVPSITTKGAKLRAVSGGNAKRRAIGAEPPLQVLARRRDKSGATYISAELENVGERLRMDYEVARTDDEKALDWDAVVQSFGQKSMTSDRNARQKDAGSRLEKAMRYLGPELGDIALITCCHQNGMEHAEKELRMPARSGKFVLRIALNMLARHYKAEGDDAHNMIF